MMELWRLDQLISLEASSIHARRCARARCLLRHLTLRIAKLLPPGGHLYSIEISAIHAAIATKIIEFAGLKDRVTFIVGTVDTRLAAVQAKYKIAKFDLVFIDHFKAAYLSDLLTLEKAGAVQSGTVLVADNCLVSGAPDYVQYVSTSPDYVSVCHESEMEYLPGVVDHVWVSTLAHLGRRDRTHLVHPFHVVHDGQSPRGCPELSTIPDCSVGVAYHVFNHKGGVGKSTSTIALGWKLASQGKRVLLVDADPQCNLTGFLVDPGYELIPEAEQPDDDPLARFYENYPHCNLRAALAPLLGNNALKAELNIPGGADLLTEVFPVADRNLLMPVNPNTNHRFGPFTHPPATLFLLAGHLLIHEYEDAINAATINANNSAQAPDIPGSFYHLFQSLIRRHNFDHVIVDMSPSAWVVNRLIVSSVHQLIVPCSCDFFSHMAVRSLASLLIDWDKLKERVRNLQQGFPVRYVLPLHKPILIGFTFQLFGVNNNAPVAAFARWMTRISTAVRDDLAVALERRGMALPANILVNALGAIRNTQSAGAAANKVHVPVWSMTSDLLRRGGTDSVQSSQVIITSVNTEFTLMAQSAVTRWVSIGPAQQQQMLLVQRACTFLQRFGMPLDQAAYPTTAALVTAAQVMHAAMNGGAQL